jgi:GT2 family glycosyltransferase
MSQSVIVCAYTERRFDDILNACDGLRRQSQPVDDVLIVVDHNIRLQARIAEALPDIRVVQNNRARGLSGARNTGVEQTRGDILLFLDDDATPNVDWVSKMLGPFVHERVMVVGGAAHPRWPDTRPEWLPRELDWVVGCSYTGLPTEVSPVRNPIGAAMAMRREVFESVGGFSEEVGRVGSLPRGCEETEICIRLQQRNPSAVVIYEPQAIVHHRVSVDRVAWRYLWRRCFAEGESKARVAQLVGRTDALAAERIYLRQTLPSALSRELAALQVRRAAAIVTAVACTVSGYLWGLRGSLQRHPRAT